MPTYAEYLKIDELLDLQRPLSDGPEHDEMLFIVIHQVYELWFKEVLHEMDYLVVRLTDNDRPRATHTLTRILTVLKTLVAQIDVLETMTPLEFKTFRDRLESGSGFQSQQFRELEFAMGVRHSWALDHFPEGSKARERLRERHTQWTVWDALLEHLRLAGYGVRPREDVTVAITPDLEVQGELIRLYRADPSAAELCERFVDLDEGVQEWRYRHVKMVQRTIGTKTGTGGTTGVEYLTTTLLKPAFPDLWAIRSEL
jgi:tryptophan 2,3-dioxygenase